MKLFAVRTFVCVAIALFHSVWAAASTGDVFTLVDDISSLHEGDEIAIVSRDYGMAMSRYEENKYVVPCGVDIMDAGKTMCATSDSLCVMTLVKQDRGWKLKDSEGRWLWTNDGTQNDLVFNSSAAYAGHTNVVTMDFLETADCIMNFKKYNVSHYVKYNGADRFKCYTNPSSVCHIQVYRKLKNVREYDSLTFGESDGNAAMAGEALDARVHKVVVDRRFVADGGCYTLCLPVDLTADEIGSAFMGAAFYRFSSVEKMSGGGFVLHFRQVESTSAGVPYLMLPVAGDGMDIVAPTLADKIILADKPKTISYTLNGITFAFVGTIDTAPLPADGRYRFVGKDGTRLVTPNSEASLRALRAYFKLSDAAASTTFGTDAPQIEAAIALDAPGADSDAETPTSVTTVAACGMSKGSMPIYNVYGQRVASDTEKRSKGVYIVNGRKFVAR